jgi:predicted glycosyltransferase involved in capsule biosynthesis|tara:strand:+ start:165 stop:344 length:180 start_codon:yes stop_codon:yes gene_type:complete
MGFPSVYLIRLKPAPKSNLNLYEHCFFHSKRDMERYLKENKSNVKDVHVAKWEEVSYDD